MIPVLTPIGATVFANVLRFKGVMVPTLGLKPSNLPTPMNILRGGLESLRGFNQRLRDTDFGRSQTLAEYFQKRRERKQAERAQKAMPSVYESAKAQGFTNERGGFSTDRADDAGTSLGSGQFSPKTSRGRSGYGIGGEANG